MNAATGATAPRGGGLRGKLSALRSSGAARSVWNIADQVISSGNNFLVQVVIAKSVSHDDFGSFAIAFAIFSYATGFFRSIGTLPVGMRFSGADDREFGRAASASLGLVVLGSVLLGGLLALGGWLGPFPGALGQSLVALGLVLPGLMMQDAWRQVLFARLRPAAACVLDGAWGALQLAAVLVLLVVGVDELWAFVLAWGGAALAAGFVGWYQVGRRPRPTRAWAWLKEQWQLTRYLVPEYVVLQSGAQLSVVVAAAVTTTAAAGSLRGANMLAVPATIMTTGLLSFAVPELGRRRGQFSGRTWKLAGVAVSGAAVSVGVVWGAVLLLMPDAVGYAVLADSWEGTKTVLLPIVLAQIGSALAVGPAAVLYANEGAKVTMKLHTVYAVLLIGLTTAGAFWAGAVGTAWGSAAAFLLIAPFWFVAVSRHVRRPSRPPSVPVTTAP